MIRTSGRELIAVIAFDQVIPFHLSVPCIVFAAAESDSCSIDVVVCAGEPGPLMTSAGFGLTGLASLAAVERADVVIMAGWRDSLDAPPRRLISALRRAHRRGAQIVGLCYGTHVLACAGLLDGRRATTHWELAAELAARFPAVEIDPNVLYVEDGGVLTSAGTCASIDACLHLLRQRLGAAVANRAARRLVVAGHRVGGQAQFIEQPLPKADADARLAKMTDWVRAHLELPHTLDTLAKRARMSRRTFTRHFRAMTGTTVKGWLLAERLALAQRLLETTDHTVETIAMAAGFGSVAALRLRFREMHAVSPTLWRSSFRHARAPLPTKAAKVASSKRVAASSRLSQAAE